MLTTLALNLLALIAVLDHWVFEWYECFSDLLLSVSHLLSALHAFVSVSDDRVLPMLWLYNPKGYISGFPASVRVFHPVLQSIS